jgi:hypothetical protein
MDKRTLVEADLVAGQSIIEGLERRGFIVDVAAWLRDYESGNWRLVISSPTVTIQGARPIYEAVSEILDGLSDANLELALDDILVASPTEGLIRDLKDRVGTNGDLFRIRLPRIDIGGRTMSARIYRVAGGTIENGARVRVKATGQVGTVRSRLESPRGLRYLVLYDLTSEQLRPLDGSPRPHGGQDYAPDDLEFLYVVRTGGWSEKVPAKSSSAP